MFSNAVRLGVLSEVTEGWISPYRVRVRVRDGSPHISPVSAYITPLIAVQLQQFVKLY